MSWLSSWWNEYSGKSQRKRDTAALGEFGATYLKQSPAELEYAQLLRDRMEKGALPVAQLTQQVGQRVGEFAQQGTAAVTGQMYNIGLGGTAASASAVGRVQSKALQAIAEQSRAIQIQNEMTKIAAGDQYGLYGAGRSDVMRRMAEMMLGGRMGISATFAGAQQGVTRDAQGFIMQRMAENEAMKRTLISAGAGAGAGSAGSAWG